MSEKEEIRPTKSALAAIAAGILVIIAGFLVYNYFSRVGKEGEIVEVTEEEELRVEGEEVAPEEEEISPEEEVGIGGPEEETLAWTANDYKEGDILGDSYTVEWGDTLWEIAEARYGSGFEWSKIKDANSESIGTLPNGSQALIVPGQVLVLPE